MAVTLSIANHHAGLPIAYRLYLPETWANDAARRKKARIPRIIAFKTKPQIALAQIRCELWRKLRAARWGISSAPLDIERIARGARSHWGVESMHWLLDVEFKDDLRATGPAMEPRTWP